MRVPLLLAAVGLGLAVAGCSSPSPPPPPPAPALDWSECTPDSRVQCTTFTVPADYSNPDGPSFTIRAARLVGTPAQPEILITNPGGPGISGVDDLVGGADWWSKYTDKYTVVSFDPRGVPESTPAMECLTDDQKARIYNQVSDPSTPTQTARARRLGELIGQNCQDRFGPTLPWVGTHNVARDMDTLRALLGAEKITYWGFSYGTFLGAVYAQDFPGRTERLLLDSAMNPALDYPTIRHDQAVGFDDSIRRFAKDCLRRASCPLAGPTDRAMRQISALVQELDADPYLGSKRRVLSGARALGLIQSSMYSPATGWPALRKVLRPALAGNFEPMLRAAYSPAQMVNPADSPYLSVVCIDFQTGREVAQPEQLAPEWAREAPITGANRAWSLQPCESWPVGPVRTPSPIAAEGSGPVLILNNTHDPATPLAWAQALDGQLAHSTLLINDADGHIVVDRNRCVQKAVSGFLRQGVLPEPGTRCTG